MSKRRKAKHITYYRLVNAANSEEASDQGLAMVLETILPDTMSWWRVAVKEIPLPQGMQGKYWDVRVDFDRVRHEERYKERTPADIDSFVEGLSRQSEQTVEHESLS